MTTKKVTTTTRRRPPSRLAIVITEAEVDALTLVISDHLRAMEFAGGVVHHRLTPRQQLALQDDRVRLMNLRTSLYQRMREADDAKLPPR